MKLYTGKGDAGQTDLLGARVTKGDPRIDLLGEIDEATSAIGLARSHSTAERIRATFVDIQRDLYRIMAEAAFTDELRPAGFHLGSDRVSWLEQQTDDLGKSVQLRPEFVLPGETVPGSTADLARAVVRRAERRAVQVHDEGLLTNPEILRYLNRLSSYLFIVARFEEAQAEVEATRART